VPVPVIVLRKRCLKAYALAMKPNFGNNK